MAAFRRLPQELLAIAHRPPSCARPFSSTPVFLLASASSSSAKAKHFYATTPIFYVNAAPHVGHLHSTLLADIYTRFARLRDPNGPRPILCTGTDEHGLKIQRVAERQGVTPRALCDTVSERFRDLARAAGIDHTIFIRTTEERHKVAVEHVWRELEKRGFIYKSSYAGWYAVSDEAYYTQAQVVELVDPVTNKTQLVSRETGSSVEWMQEDNYKFRLSAFRDRLITWLSESSVLQPPSRAKVLLGDLTAESSTDLQDLSISRPASRLTWGISVPGDPEHTIYVWIDALVNYMTAAGYPWQGGEAYAEGEVWPPDLMVVGKDIIRFHALYLPAVLMALELPLPKTLLAHGHWTMDRFKMSKSRGNVADPFQAMQLWGRDAMRMYLMAAGGNSGVDADYSAAAIERFYRKKLAANLGSSLARISNPKLLARLPSPESISVAPLDIKPEDENVHRALLELPDHFATAMNSYEVHKAMDSVFTAIEREVNGYLDLTSPWLKTSSADAVHRACFYTSEALRLAGILLTPVMPGKSQELLDALGVPLDARTWAHAKLGRGGKRSMVLGSAHLFPTVKVETE